MLSIVNFLWSYHYFGLTAKDKTCYFLEMMLECSTGSHFTSTGTGPHLDIPAVPGTRGSAAVNHLDVMTARNG